MARTGTNKIKKYNKSKPTNSNFKTNGDLTKFGKNYFTKKITNIIKNNKDANEYELLNVLKQQKITNDKIEGNINFRDLLRNTLKNIEPATETKKNKKPTGQRLLEKETSNKIVNHFINEIVPLLNENFKNIKIDYNDVMEFIKGYKSNFKQEMLKTINEHDMFKKGKIPFKLGEAIQLFINKHRRNIAEQVPVEQGKNTFTVVFRSVVYDSRYNHRHTEKKKTTFKSDEVDEKAFTRDFIKVVVQNYYDRLDYPDFLHLLQYKVIKTSVDIDISTIYLYNYGGNSKYNNIYIRPPDEYIIGWNKQAETLEYKQCVKFNLRCGFGKFIDQLKNKDVFTDKYLNTFFENNGGFTIENILLFVKLELENKASIYILDPTGHVIVGSYINSKTKITINIDGTETLKRVESSTTTAFILNGNHVDLITEPNIIKSLSNGSIPNLFETNLNTDNLKHELFNRPEIIALQADFNDVVGQNKDYTENGKNTTADVVLLQDLEDGETYEIEPKTTNQSQIIEYDNGNIEIVIKTAEPKKGITDIHELIELVKKRYNVIITNILIDRYNSIYGFVHPITKQIFMKTNDFYKRKATCDKMYDEMGYNELKFNNQSWLAIIKLKMKFYNLGDFDRLLSNMSEYDKEVNQKYPLTQKIGRCDDDNYLKLRMRDSGTDNVYTFDLVKSRASILYNRLKDNYWAIADAFDNYEIFNKNDLEHVNIPCGEYFLKEGNYGSQISQIKFNAGKYHDTTIKYMLEQEYMTINGIIGIRISKKTNGR